VRVTRGELSASVNGTAYASTPILTSRVVKDEVVEKVQSQSNYCGKPILRISSAKRGSEWRVSKRASVVRYSASVYERSS